MMILIYNYMWLIYISLIIFLLFIIIFFSKIKKIKKNAEYVFLNIINLEKQRENERKKRAAEVVYNYSYKVHQLILLNKKYETEVPKEVYDFKYYVNDYFNSKRKLDNASTYSYMSRYSNKAQKAIDYQACKNDLIDKYKDAINRIEKYKTPKWAVELSGVDENEFLYIENNLFNQYVLNLKKTYEVPSVYVYLSYTSPAGRNHWTKSSTHSYDYKPSCNIYKSLVNGINDDYHILKPTKKIKIDKTEDSIFITPVGCIDLSLDDTLDIISTKEFINRVDIQSIVIPSTVKKIEKEAFKGCLNLKKVVILGESIEIEDDAFCGCYHLEKIESPKKIIISDKSFCCCYKLQNK